MNAMRPILTVRVAVPSRASREAVYELLAELDTHLVWAGTRAPRSDFRLLSIEAPQRRAVVGDRFSSDGASANGTFHDRSLVVEAEPGARFGFDTESTLERRHGPTWHARVTHRYTVAETDDGVTIVYTNELWPENYVPYWLKPGVRRMARILARRFTRANLENLARMAETVRSERPAG